jgi:hypothetical protein
MGWAGLDWGGLRLVKSSPFGALTQIQLIEQFCVRYVQLVSRKLILVHRDSQKIQNGHK